jgi:hypothetical protein
VSRVHTITLCNVPGIDHYYIVECARYRPLCCGMCWIQAIHGAYFVAYLKILGEPVACNPTCSTICNGIHVAFTKFYEKRPHVILVHIC